jgi:hypothetical protein
MSSTSITTMNLTYVSHYTFLRGKRIFNMAETDKNSNAMSTI